MFAIFYWYPISSLKIYFLSFLFLKISFVIFSVLHIGIPTSSPYCKVSICPDMIGIWICIVYLLAWVNNKLLPDFYLSVFTEYLPNCFLFTNGRNFYRFCIFSDAIYMLFFRQCNFLIHASATSWVICLLLFVQINICLVRGVFVLVCLFYKKLELQTSIILKV